MSYPPNQSSDAAKTWLDLIEQEAKEIADRENEASSHCGPYGTETADDYRASVTETFEKIGQAYVAAGIGQ